MQAFVGCITSGTICRISEGFVIKGDSTKPEITRCRGSVPGARATVTMEGRDRMEATPLQQGNASGAISE